MSNQIQALTLAIAAAIDNAATSLKNTIAQQIAEALTEPSAPANPCDCPRERIEVQKVVVEGTQVRYDMPALKKGAVYRLMNFQNAEQATLNFNDPNGENELFFEQNSGEEIFFEAILSGLVTNQLATLNFDISQNGANFGQDIVCLNPNSNYRDFQGNSLPFGVANSPIRVGDRAVIFIKTLLRGRNPGGIPVYNITNFLL
jgi:hypothetical protein